MEWFRLYTDMPNDPKIGTLTDSQFRTWVELLCLAGREGNGGSVGASVEQATWCLRRDVSCDVPVLVTRGLVSIDPKTGEIRIEKWSKRQFSSDNSTVRTRKYRENKKGTSLQRHSDAIEQNRTDTEQNREENKRLLSDTSDDYVFVWITEEKIKEWEGRYPDVDVQAVIARAKAYRQQHPDRREEDLKIGDWLVKALQKEQERSVKGKAVEGWFGEIWVRYPRKDGRKAAQRHFLASVQSEADWRDINLALDHYLSHLKREGTETRYVKTGPTWFNNWRDWLDWQPTAGGKANDDWLDKFAAGEV